MLAHGLSQIQPSRMWTPPHSLSSPPRSFSRMMCVCAGCWTHFLLFLLLGNTTNRLLSSIRHRLARSECAGTRRSQSSTGSHDIRPQGRF